MNLIEKVIIKDGVNADTTVIINQYTGQVAEINAKIAHPFIPNTRGVASYSLSGGITPRFSFSAVGDNEMWIYIDGIGVKVDGITTLDPDTSIKILPNTGNTTYTYTAEDSGKILIITNLSGVNTINANLLADGDSFLFLNNSTSNKTISGSIDGESFVILVKSKTFFNIYRNSNTIYQNVIYSLEDSIKNIGYNSGNITNLVVDDLKFPFYEFGYAGSKVVNIPIGWPSGKELTLANIATGNATINLPSGQTFYGGATNMTLLPGQNVTLVYSGSSGLWHALN